jgi:nucleotide sugar dehydrogenase
MRSQTVTVVGLGKIGLPLAVQIAKSGYKVRGADLSSEVVKMINLGNVPFPGEENLDLYLKEVVAEGSLVATTDTTDAVANSGFVIVVVPLYVDDEGTPDFRSIDSATAQIARGLQKDTLVSYETTLPIGTTRNRFTQSLEKLSKLEAGTSFHVVFSPERVFTGRVFEDLKKYPKLVGGINQESELRGIAFYREILEFTERPDLSTPNGVWSMGSCEAAEFAKLAETTYRDVNIGLANQFALFAENHKIDINKIIEASNSQPFSHIHNPGIAVGGHCIPIYPQMYLWSDPLATIVSAARSANLGMPEKCIQMLEKLHGSLENCKVVVLGASYRGGVKEIAFSGVFSVVEALKRRGALPLVQDPIYSESELTELGFEVFRPGDSIDAIVVQADHKEYREFNRDMFPDVKTVLDGRGILNQEFWKGTKFHILGRAAK